MLNSRTPREVVDDAYDAILKKGDIEAFLKDFDDNSVLQETPSLPYGGTFKGKDAVRKALMRVFEYWKDFLYKPEHILADEEWVMAYGEFSATSIKTGKKVAFPLAEIWRIRQGRVVLVTPVYSDTKAVLDALG